MVKFAAIPVGAKAFDKTLVNNLINILEVAFPWDKSDEGYAYWADVHGKLCSMVGISCSFSKISGS